jgi:AcrR family transcriptional regulator
MPLKTFHNLDEKRKSTILNEAYHEFAFNAYQSASVSTIVKKLGIAKGSFYRYFKDKADLFAFLLEKISEKRMSQLRDLLEVESAGFFGIIREYFRKRIIFDLEHSVESIFLFNVLREYNAPEIKTIIDDYKKEVLLFISSLVVVFQKKGEINKDISPEVASQFIFQTQLGIYEYLSVFKGIDFRTIIEEKDSLPVTEKQIMEVADEMLVIVKSGLKAE